MASGPPVRHDFSVCLNAFGPAPTVLEAIRSAPVDEYPDGASSLARAAASRAWSVPMDSLILGAGSAELIDLACRAFVAPGDIVAIDAPAFGEYERAARIYGATVVHAIDDTARVVFIGSPSNPLGQVSRREELVAIANACAERGSLLVLDQAYDEFAEIPSGTPALRGHPAVLHLRSLTKGHAIAGIRVAFGIGTSRIIDAMSAVRVPWSASSVAQCAAVAALEPEATKHVEKTTSVLRREAGRLRASLSTLGYEIEESRTHFFTVRMRSAADARFELLERFQLLVRDCSSFGLPDRIRVAARIPAANDELLHALAKMSSTLL